MSSPLDIDLLDLPRSVVCPECHADAIDDDLGLWCPGCGWEDER